MQLKQAKGCGERLNSSSYTWYAIRVQPQRELVAQTILGDQGFATFVAVSKRWEFGNRANRARMSKREVKRTLMPGYVFVGMNEHTPGWDRIVSFAFVTGIISRGDRPLVIPHDPVTTPCGKRRPGLRDLMWQQAGGKFNAPDYEKWQDTNHTFGPGDEVFLFGEQRGKILDIEDRKARVLVDFLGGPREIEADVTKLKAVG